MNQNYRNSLYSNSSESSRNGGGSWVYINGELYHYGRPGMEWGKHLPGTDWWKEKVSNIKSRFRSEYNDRAGTKTYQIGPSSLGSHYENSSSSPLGRMAKARAALGAAASTAKYIGQGLAKYSRRLPGHMVKEVTNIGRNIKEDFRDAGKALSKNLKPILRDYYSKASSNDFLNNKMNGDTPLNHLDSRLNKEFDEARNAYMDAISKGDFGSTVNAFIQNAQFNILNGINGFLKKRNLDVKVENFLSKFY